MLIRQYIFSLSIAVVAVFFFPNMHHNLDDVQNLEQSKAEPVSTCEMELDCSAADILNSLDVQGIHIFCNSLVW